MRWFYYYPTWTKPSGGNKQIRLMASLLPDLGVEARLLRDRKFFEDPSRYDDNSFYGVPVPNASFPFEEGGQNLGPDDVVILPEVVLGKSLDVARAWQCRFALYNQNGFYGLRYGGDAAVCGRRLEFVISIAPYIASLCKTFLGVPPERIFHVPVWVVRPPFSLQEREEAKTLAVCYMPRKMPDQVKRVRELVQASHPDVPWVEIDGLPEPEVAVRYRANKIFFAAQDLEGCPLTALEAMACGCLVAGFPGTGRFAHPYATPANGLWAADRNIPAAAAAVRSAIDVVRGGDRYHRYLEAGRETARRYSEEPVKTAIAELVAGVKERNYRARRRALPALGWKGTLFAYRLLYDYDRLGWTGRLVSGVSQMTKPLRSFLSRVCG